MLLRCRQSSRLLSTCRSIGSSSSEPCRITGSDVETFGNIVGGENVVTDAASLAGANVDFMKKYRGRSKVAVYPRTTAEVSALLRHCSSRRLAVVPQGGNTGLVGGAVPLGDDEVILGLRRMRTIEPMDRLAGIVECEAGVVLEELDSYVGQYGYRVPLDLGAKGSCHIGGNLATNAGGTRYLRYGSLHGNVLGLEAVLADGTVLRDTLKSSGGACSTLRKDNTGYDLKQLFIGSEGTLGVITRLSLLCPPRLPSVQVAVLAVRSFADCVGSFNLARHSLGEIISAFEFFDRRSLELVIQAIPGAKDPFPDAPHPFYCLLETSGSSQQHDQEKLAAFLEAATTANLVVDGTCAQDHRQATQLWKLRESIAVALSHIGAVYKYDLSLPLERMYDLVEATKERLQDTTAVTVGYGHLGDANLHLNVLMPDYQSQIEQLLEPWVYQWTQQHGGSISAEHGLGQMKAKYIGYTKPQTFIDTMRLLKKAFDPHNILNPDKVIMM